MRVKGRDRVRVLYSESGERIWRVTGEFRGCFVEEWKRERSVMLECGEECVGDLSDMMRVLMYWNGEGVLYVSDEKRGWEERGIVEAMMELDGELVGEGVYVGV